MGNSEKYPNLTHIKKGQVLNPKGRGKGTLNIKTKIRQMLKAISEDGEPESPIVKGILSIMNDSDENGAVRLKAFDMLMDRMEGKAQQKVDNTSSDGSMATAPTKIEIVAPSIDDYSKDTAT